LITMLLISCPWCGRRNADEFGYVGEFVARPDPQLTTPEEWRGYLYLRDNRADWVTERWFHRLGCRRYITVRRHRASNWVAS
jgi:sarcosine oxidase, subunit delta